MMDYDDLPSSSAVRGDDPTYSDEVGASMQPLDSHDHPDAGLTLSGISGMEGIEEAGEEEEEEEGEDAMKDSSEEEEEDEEAEEEVRRGFIVDSDDEEERRRRKRRKKKHRKHREREEGGEDEGMAGLGELDVDDLDLLEENTGRPLEGRKRLRRFGEEDGEREDLYHMFDEPGGRGDEEERGGRRMPWGREDEMADFIEEDFEDEDGEERRYAGDEAEDRPVYSQARKGKKKRTTMEAFSGANFETLGDELDQDTWNEIQEVFGTGDDYAWALEGDDEPALTSTQPLGLKDIFEPSQIASRLLTDEDEYIRSFDVPERMQLAFSSLASTLSHRLLASLLKPWDDEEEIERCVNWMAPRISPRTNQEFVRPDREGKRPVFEREYRECLKKCVEFFHREFWEVPFVWTHRKDYLVPHRKDRNKVEEHKFRMRRDRVAEVREHKDEASIDMETDKIEKALEGQTFFIDQMELWTANALSARFRAMLERKHGVKKTLGKLLRQREESRPKKLEDALEMLKLEKRQEVGEYEIMEEEIDRSRIPEHLTVPTGETDPYFDQIWRDIETVEEVNDLSEWMSWKYKEEMEELRMKREYGLEPRDEEDEEREKEAGGGFKKPVRETWYERTRKSAVFEFGQTIGLPPSDLANAFVNRGSNDANVPDFDQMPLEYASRFVRANSEWTREDHILDGAKMVAATDIGHDPQLRRAVRRMFMENGTVTVKPTEKGMSKIDDMHPYYEFKYLKAKPVHLLCQSHQFLNILAAEFDGLVTIDINVESRAVNEFRSRTKDAYLSKTQTRVSEAWNSLREEIIEEAIQKHLFPVGVTWTRNWLREEEEEFVGNKCAVSLQNTISMAPYWNKSVGKPFGSTPDIIAVSHGHGDPKHDLVWAVHLDSSGRYVRHLKLENLRDPENREKFKSFILEFKSTLSAIVVGGFTPSTAKLMGDVKIITGAAADELKADIHYEDALNDTARSAKAAFDCLYIQDDVARIYHVSQRAAEEFPSLPPIFRYCVGLARYAQSPINEYAALGKDMTAVTYDPWQKLLSREKVMNFLERAMINVMNLVGIDINKAVHNNYYATLLQYICGLGPRKGQALISKISSKLGGHVVSRHQLIQTEVLTPGVWMNCASFLEIPLSNAPDITAHAEGVVEDALDGTRIHNEDYDIARKMAADAMEMDEEEVRDIAENPSKYVRDLMQIKDKARRLEELSLDDFSDQLQSIMGVPKRSSVHMIREEIQDPYGEKRSPFNPPQARDVFTMLTGETRATLDHGLIIPVVVTKFRPDEGVNVRLDSGVEGVVFSQHLSDTPTKAAEVFHIGQTVQGMVIAVNHQQFSVELSCQNSALATGDADFRRVAVDVYYDLDAADQDKMAMERKAKRKSNKLRRVVQHPNFHNFNAGQAEQHLAGRPRGDCVIRPSSRGMDHLALTWKVDEGVYQHLDILELDKPNEASLGRTLRVGGKYSYSDLDELIFSHVKAMARKVEEMMNSEKYKGSEQELNTFLTNYVMANPDKSIYAFGIDKRNPGQFLCSFKANSSSPIQSWSVKLVPGAFVLQDKFSDPLPDMVMLCNAFKTRYTVMGQQARAAPARTQPTPYHQSSRTPNPYAAQTPMHPSRTPNPYAAPSAGSHTPHYGAPTPRVPPVGTVYATTPHYGAPTPVWPPPGSQTPNFPYQQPGPQHAGWGGTTPGGPGGGALQQQSYGYR